MREKREERNKREKLEKRVARRERRETKEKSTERREEGRENREERRERREERRERKRRRGVFARGGEGFASLLGGYLPWTPDPLRTEGLEILIAIFWPSCCASFFHRFFDAIFERSWLDFASQLCSQNPPTSMKNRCQDAFHLGLDFLMDFGGFWEASWGGKSSQEASKMASKK